MTDQNARPPTDRQCRETRQRVGRQWDEASAAWDLCEPYFATGSWPVTQKLIAGLHLSAGARVLDVGCGVGDPALQIAAAVGPQGTVLAIDLAPGMVAATRRRAQVLGLANITCRVAAAEELTEPAGSFDAVAARFTLMSMPDIPGNL